MRPAIWVLAVTIAATTVLVVRAQNLSSTTQPTEPARVGTGVIRGRVAIKGASLFQNPDLSRVVVYLGSSEALDRIAGPTTRASVSQRSKAFAPGFLIVPRGTDVEFPNWDRFDHNVFSRSAAAPAFDLDRYPYGQSKSRIFDKLGVVQVFCNIHPDMRAVIYVVPNGYFARADREGNFEIGGLPAGSFEVAAWHERCGEQRQVCDVSSNHPIEISFSLQESRDNIFNSADSRRGAYGVERGLGVKQEQLNLPVVRNAHAAPEESRP